MSIVTPGGGGGGRSRRDQDPGSGAPRTPGQAGRIIRPRAKAKPVDPPASEQVASDTAAPDEAAPTEATPTEATPTEVEQTTAATAKAPAPKAAAKKTPARKAPTRTTPTKPAAKTPAKAATAGGTRSSSSGSTPKRPAAKKSARAAAGGKGPGAKGPGGKGPGGKGPGGKGPTGRGGPGGPGGKRPKSIVNQRQTPWTLIAVTVVIVLFAGGIVAYAVTRGGGSSKGSGDNSLETSANTKDVSPANASAADIAKIRGITHKTFTGQQHQNGVIDYGSDSPPFGGKHNQVWAQCTGVVYSKQLANENAVHTLEHGAVWITYRPGLDQKSIDTLKKKVLGNNYMLMTPYQGLKTPISLQAWGYQLFVDSADDPRIDEFIKDLRLNPKTIPEYGASCDQPLFKASESYPGHPQDVG